MTVNFYLNNNNISKNPEKIIFCYVREKGKTLTLHTGERILPKYWDTDKQHVKKSYIGSEELNSYLQRYKEKVKQIVRTVKLDNLNPNFETIKTALYSYFKDRNLSNSVIDRYKEYIDMKHKILKKSSASMYKPTLYYLEEFQKAKNYQLTYDSLDNVFNEKFKIFLIEMRLAPNTIDRIFSQIRSFVLWSIDRKLTDNKQALKLSVKVPPTDFVYLTEQELLQLYNAELDEESSKVRDMFCFMCFTGARVSDVQQLNLKEDIKQDVWTLKVQKTSDILRIPLNKYALAIFRRYYEAGFEKLPIISQQMQIKKIRKIMKEVGINTPCKIVKYRGEERIEVSEPKYELIGFHTARRTFIILSLEKGMRAEVVMDLVGHKDFRTFQKYIKIASDVSEREINTAWGK